ncbi:hypothetical protein L226DRAFT_529416 [Lentinus tigrinus ALCF2SS1-7]|uniref:Nucleoporin Nup82 n=1 Tax=Lentinus tigrinus ALCF2SS1-6 TaxID=1328759 RepID=A0A5C2T4M8_9APHY|nr:hypothetical protein L227DRAFT_537837 [Lentinus tigrinus ALCF2SS1-6]RPD80968.1 hypothetical protein L226DRAFT_529416 [Lentinus tigrinus ALCF2SS1-7]
MSSEEDWDELLRNHPVFTLPKRVSGRGGKGEASLNLSLSSLPDFVDLDPVDDKPTPSGRRQAIAIKDADLIVAVGSEIRIASLGDSKGARGTSQKSYKILHTPNIQFEIHQIALNPNGKLLAVAGAFQVAVVVLPRTGFNKLVTATVDCKSFQIGQYYHAAESSAPVAKIEWHPWGQGGSTLMVMTTDGKLREYDISVDADEPQQTTSFVPERRMSHSFLAEDAAEREVVSFALGKGRADWGPLTVYALMKSGDVYAVCPYMPKNASIPSSYIHALECYVAAKQEFLSSSTNSGDSSSSDSLTTLYDYQHKYVSALIKQLPPGTAWPATARLVPMHPPTTIKNSRARQGPFLLQPAPRLLEGSEGGDATDIVYMSFGDDAAEESEGETERLGLVLVSFQDGKVDLYLDVEKVEARWELKQHPSNDLPMLAVYESIDLGIVSSLTKASSRRGESLLNLIQGNHPVFQLDPIHDDTLYVYHAFGVHVLNLRALLRSLAAVLRDGNDSEAGSSSGLEASLETVKSTEVQPILLTFSVEQQCSSPVIGVAVPNDVYLTYSIFILTSSMRMSVFPLTLRSEASFTADTRAPSPEKEKAPLAIAPPPTALLPSKPEPAPSPKKLLAPPDGPPAYISLLSTDPWKTPQAVTRPSGLPSNPRLSLPGNLSASGKEIALTPETLRYLGTTVEKLSSQIHDVQLANRATEARAALQEQEFRRQRETCAKMLEIVRALGTTRQEEAQARIAKAQETQKALLARSDRVLQGLMKKASPALSENEAKWFEELRRTKEEVVGAGRYDDRSLSAKAKLLRREVDRLLPHLKEMKEKETARRKSVAESREALGLSQAFELGKRSTEERARIGDMEAEILRLAHRLDVDLGRPPSQQHQKEKVGAVKDE